MAWIEGNRLGRQVAAGSSWGRAEELIQGP